MVIEELVIPYDDFVTNTVIDPEQFDANNAAIATKTNEIAAKINTGIVGSDIKSVTVDDILGDTYSNTGTLVQILSWFSKRIKAIIGGDYWLSNIPCSLTELDTRVTTIESSAVSGTIIKQEVYTIVNSNLGDGTFSYTVNGGTVIGTLGSSGEQIFTLTQGSYVTGQNRLEALINDTLMRSAASGGLVELSTTTFEIVAPQAAGVEITAKYFESMDITNERAVIYSDTEPTTDLTSKIWFKVVS